MLGATHCGGGGARGWIRRLKPTAREGASPMNRAGVDVGDVARCEDDR